MTENEYAKKLIPLILGTFPSRITKSVQVISEVPKFSNINHMDLLLIDRKRKKMMSIEFKLKNPKDLSHQVYRNRDVTKINCIGIVNQIKALKPVHDPEKRIYYLKEPGMDRSEDEVYRLSRYLICRNIWTDISYSKYGMLYWYGYMDHKQFDIENVGEGTCKRLSFFHLYKMAIKNLLREGMGPEIMSKIFGVYSNSSVKKYYQEVINEQEIH